MTFEYDNRARLCGNRRLSIAALAGALMLAACSGGGNGTTSASSSASGDILVQDAPVSSLLSFSATVTEVRLLSQGSAPTANLLPQSSAVEFLGLQASASWLSNVSFPEGTYTGVRVVFDAASVTARAKDGTIVPVTVASDTMDSIFVLPLVVSGAGDYDRVLIDLDLLDSLVGDVTGLTFTPMGDTELDDGSQAQPLDEFRGVVDSFSEADLQMTVSAFVDDDLTVSLGQVVVSVQAGATLVRQDGAFFVSNSAFFANLQVGASLVEVHGNLGLNGGVDATKIEVEDQASGAGVASLVKIEGVVASTTAGSFDLMIAEVEKGMAVAQPVLTGLGNPLTITISHDASTDFFHEDGTAATSADVAVGQKIKVYLSDFIASPFPAYRVRVHGAPASEAVLTDVTGLPGSVIVNIDADEPLVTSGQVATGTTNVTVDLSTTEVVLDVHGKPALAVSQLQSGLEIKVEGPLAGLTISAAKVKVRPGRLRGQVSGTTAPLTFTATLGQFKDPFGAMVDQIGPYVIQIDPGARFKKDAANAAEFMALFANLLTGESVSIRVKGIGTGNANEIVAYEIEAEVQ